MGGGGQETAEGHGYYGDSAARNYGCNSRTLLHSQDSTCGAGKAWQTKTEETNVQKGLEVGDDP